MFPTATNSWRRRAKWSTARWRWARRSTRDRCAAERGPMSRRCPQRGAAWIVEGVEAARPADSAEYLVLHRRRFCRLPRGAAAAEANARRSGQVRFGRVPKGVLDRLQESSSRQGVGSRREHAPTWGLSLIFVRRKWDCSFGETNLAALPVEIPTPFFQLNLRLEYAHE